MIKLYQIIVSVLVLSLFLSCSKEEEQEPMLVLKFKFDPNQARLNNLGQPSVIPQGNAAQTPIFNSIASHYIELAPNANTQLGKGQIIYHALETNLGGNNAIDFSKAIISKEGEVFLKIPLSKIQKGSYEWLRVSLSYQNFEIKVKNQGVEYQGTFASFVGFNNYITSHTIKNTTFPVNGNRLQGYWAFALNDYPYSTSGQAPEGATTVPNPLASSSPIPAGSCVVTGKFENKLDITGNESSDITLTLSLSINNSFEWNDLIPDSKFEPAQGEKVVDMGLRGLIPSYTK